MPNANIVQNNSPSRYGVVYAREEGSRLMMFCIFKNNQDTLFYVHEGSLEVSHSFIEHSSQSLSYGAVSTLCSILIRLFYKYSFVK